MSSPGDDRLHRQGFVVREDGRPHGLLVRGPDPVDRRRRVLRLIDASRAVLDQVRADVRSAEEGMLSPLTAQETEDLRRFVVACHGALADEPPH